MNRKSDYAVFFGLGIFVGIVLTVFIPKEPSGDIPHVIIQDIEDRVEQLECDMWIHQRIEDITSREQPQEGTTINDRR